MLFVIGNRGRPLPPQDSPADGQCLNSQNSAVHAGRVTLPARIGPVEFGELGKLVTVRCPREFDHLMRGAGGQWEPGSRQWLVERRRIGPVIRTLEKVTDPLFRRAGLTLE
jgi:hypothetical protein